VGRSNGCVCDDHDRAASSVHVDHDHSATPEILLAMFMITEP
jgi:hypothetical protein